MIASFLVVGNCLKNDEISPRWILSRNKRSENTPNTSPSTELASEVDITVTEGQPWPEPGPEWSKAFKDWGWAWHGHTFTFGILFILITLYAGYYTVANLYDGLQRKYFSISLNFMMVLFGCTRIIILFIDPYHQGNFTGITLDLMRTIWSAGSPFLLSSDTLCLLALVETAKLNIAPQRMQKLQFILPVTAAHFTLVVVTDFVVSSNVDAKIMLLFCQLFGILWGLLTGTGYCIIGFKVDSHIFQKLGRQRRKKDLIYLALIYASGALNFLCSGVAIYSAVGVFGIYSDIKFVDTWAWWAWQTVLRATEIATCVLVFTVSAKRNRVKTAREEINVRTEPNMSLNNLRAMENAICISNGMERESNEQRTGSEMDDCPRELNNMILSKSRTVKVFPDSTYDSKTEEIENRQTPTIGRSNFRKESMFSRLHKQKLLAVLDQEEEKYEQQLNVPLNNS